MNISRKAQGRVFAFSAIRELLRDQPVSQSKGFAAFALQKQAAGRHVTLEGSAEEVLSTTSLFLIGGIIFVRKGKAEAYKNVPPMVKLRNVNLCVYRSA